MPRFRGYGPSHRRRRPVRRRRRGGRRFVRRQGPALDPEKKTAEFVATVAPDTTGIVSFVNGVALGSSPNERIGLQQMNVSNFCRYRILIDAGTTSQIVRVALVLDLQPRGTLPPLMDIWILATSNFGVLSGRNIQLALRYKVLWSRTHILDLQHQIIERQVVKPLHFKTRYGAAGGAIADVTTGALYFVCISDQLGGTVPEVRFFCRTRFVG